MGLNPIEAFATWLADTGDDWPADAVESAHREFIDIVAVTIPGAAEPVSRKAFATVKDWGEGPATVVGHGRRLAAPWAALVNGAAGHALDFDDNFDPPKAHPTTVLAPAIFALGEQLGRSGHACIDAYICGLQILGRVGQGLNPPHRNRGWHATATVGAIGASAACARLLGLDANKAAFALSIATSMSAGFMSQFGTMTKPLHAGFAAKAGILAASLAGQGVTAGRDTLDGPTGMNRLMVGPDYERLRDSITNPEHGQNLRFETESVGEPLLITEHGFRVKRFANCGSAHRAMDGLLALKQQYDFTAGDVDRIDVHAPKVHLNNLMYEDPVDPLQAKFSLEYALAVCLKTGDCRLSDFETEAVMRPEIRALFGKIHRHPVDKLEMSYPTRIAVTLKDGRVVEEIVAMPRGSRDAPFSNQQYWKKFDDCAAGYLRESEAETVRQLLTRLPQLDAISDLTGCLARPYADNGTELKAD